MAYDLRREPWIPFRRRSGEAVWGPAKFLTDKINDDPIVALAAPRPDFNGALLEFLIGLITVALQPEDEEAWRDGWRNPPLPERLQFAFDALPPAFDLDGDGPRFMQDDSPDDFSDDEANSIDTLLIDAAGGQTARLNKDLFVKRDRIDTLGRPAAAIALLTLQTYAPSGGQGHRTSMRGGGPLTTLIEPRVRDGTNGLENETRADELPLWSKLWANVETVDQWRERGPDSATMGAEALYPWLARTRISDPKRQGRPTTLQDAHPLQAYFGMPRRIRLVFEPRTGRCEITGREDTVLATGFYGRNYGVQYNSWLHPLTPYYKDKDGNWLPTHGQSDGIGWRDWAGLLFGTPDNSKRPAQCVAHFRAHRARRADVPNPRLHAFGYDMDNMKARGWVEAELPAFALDDDARIKLLSNVAANLTEAASIVASGLLIAVKAAWFARADDTKGDLSYVKARLWSDTQEDFFLAMKTLANDATRELQVRRGFLMPLETAVLGIFDSLCPMEGLEFADMRRLVSARHNLRRTLQGYGKLGDKFFAALAIQSVQTPKTGRKKKEAA